jgi:membrane-anchored glycerophosphoryl diester phosphodiesterase (GDPDase)
MPKKNAHRNASSETLPDAFSLFRPSWNALRVNLSTFALLLLFPVGMMLLTALTWEGVVQGDKIVLGIAPILSFLAAIVVSLVTTAILVSLELKSVENEHVGFDAALRFGLPYLPRLIGLFVVSGLIMLVGFLLLIIPGFFAIQRLLLAPYFLVDKNTGVKEAIRLSWRASKKHSSAMWGIAGIIVAINIVSLLPTIGWFIGMVLTILYLCAPAVRYLQIKRLKA